MFYEPAEDSYLLEKYVKVHAKGRVLDMGTGSGILALAALDAPETKEVVAVDINDHALAHIREIKKEKNLRRLRVLGSNLFAEVEGVFDTVICNPPYLPADEGVEDIALYGGKHGWEFSARFFAGVSAHLAAKGSIFFLFSSLTKKDKIDELIAHRLLEASLILEQKLAFERLYVYRVTKSPLLQELERHHVFDLRYYAKGKRGMIYRGVWEQASRVKTHFARSNPVQVAIKVKHPSSEAVGNLEREAAWLKVLHKQGVGPKLCFAHKDEYFVYEFIEGVEFRVWAPVADVKDLIVVLKRVLYQCHLLDKLGISKEELHRPHKHVLVDTSNHPWLIDFERAHYTDKPQNVTQFLEGVARYASRLPVTVDAPLLRDLAKVYRDGESYASVKKLVFSQAITGKM